MEDSIQRLREALSDKYAIEEVLGSGGMAIVYRGLDLKHHRRVAIKVMRPEFETDDGSSRFQREIRVLSQLSHPHVLPLLDSGQIGDLCFLVMPYCEGETLRNKLLREGPLRIEDAVQFACEIADALEYAHSHGVIHRDVKPQNIMLESRHAILTDFGIALATGGSTQERLTSKSSSLGTPHYMSPEQAGGERQVDGRADIYSLGCVVYEMLIGEPPFRGPNLLAIIARHAVEPPPRMGVVRNTVSAELEAVVRRALAKAPADRYATADDFRRALTAAHLQTSARATAASGSLVPVDPQTDTSETWTGWLEDAPVHLRIGAAVLFVLLVLGATGLLTVAAFDAKVQMPARFTPSESNFPFFGARALVVPLFVAFIALIGLHAARFVWQWVVTVTAAIPGVGPRSTRIATEIRSRWNEWWRSRSPQTLFDFFFLAAVACSGLVLLWLAPHFRPIYTPDVEALGCLRREEHRMLQPAITILIVGIVAGWRHISRALHKHAGTGRTPLPHWRVLALLCFLVLAMTLPWRLTWVAGTERVRVGGERGYLLLETETELVIYNADRRVATAVRRDQNTSLERLGVHGYIFEEPEVFESGLPECQSLNVADDGRSEP